MLVANYYRFVLFFVLIAAVCSTADDDDSNVPKKRLKRYLGFKQGARTFVSELNCYFRCSRTRILLLQFRINIKDNVLKVNQIWAHAYGFRQNFDIPFPLPKQYKVRRRDVHDSLELMLNQWVFYLFPWSVIKSHIPSATDSMVAPVCFELSAMLLAS